MNLYLINANDSGNEYGIGTYFKELTHSLKDANIHVCIIHLHSDRPEFIIEKVRQSSSNRYVENWYIPEVRNIRTFTGSIPKLEDYCRNVAYLLRLHIKDTTDLVFHFNYNHYHFLAKELKIIFNCKTIHTIHFITWALTLQGNLTRLHALKKKPENQRTTAEQSLFNTDDYEILLYKEVDHIIALSRHTHNHLCSEYKIDSEKITVIPNGLEDKRPLLDSNKTVLRRKWRIRENEFVILFSGRLHAAKGIGYLIRAFRQVLTKNPDCRLIIAGNGDFDIFLKECDDLWTHVTWTGRIYKDKLSELYTIADIGILPSLTEQCSYVAIEMMKYGVPLIASDCSGLSEMVADSITGLHIPVIEYNDRIEINTDLLAGKMLYLLQHPDERKRLGANARKRYETVYSAEIFRQNMLEFYSSLFL